LSIIDIDGGSQPMTSSSERTTLVYNGEIYNYRDLAETWLSGVQLRTRSDTEVLLELIEANGVRGLSKLRGMFAFGAMNHARGELLLARDPLGIKPLYYAETPSGLAFASEITALKALLDSTTPDPHALVSYLRYAYVPEPDTIYKEIKALEPASWLLYGPNGLERGCYWRPSLDSTSSQRDIVENLLERLDECTRMRLLADVPVASLLSGGIDSALIASSLGDGHRYFNLSFGSAYDESGLTRSAAEHLGLDLEIVTAEMKLEDQDFRTLATHVGQPFADTSLFACDRVFERVCRTHKVCLSADGADEVFAGYSMRRTRMLDLLAGPIRRVGRERGRQWLEERLLKILRTYLDWTHLDLTSAVLPEILESYQDTYWERVKAEVRRGLDETDDLSNIASWILLRFNLPNDMLVKVDRASMAHSIEVRVPFLDHTFVEWGLKLPSGKKQDLRQTKKPLRMALKQRGFTRETTGAPKRGFGPSPSTWSNALSEYNPGTNGALAETLRADFLEHNADSIYIRLAALWEDVS